MASTDILPFGTGTGANVMSQSAYAALAARTAGFSTGTAFSEQLNKVWRQSSFVAAGMANWIVAQGVSVPDDGSIAGFVTELTQALTNFLQPTIAAGVPTGAVMPFGQGTVPAGWLECNGAAVSRTTYASLFAAIGTTYGTGDGSTTFNLPDLRGEFVRGWDNGRGVDSGRARGSSQSDEFKSHTHRLPTETGGTQDRVSMVWSLNADEGISTDPNDVSGATGGAETRPRNVALMYCIKA